MKFAVLFALLLVITAYELYERRIPRRYLAAALISGFLFHGIGSSQAGMIFSVLGVLLPFFLLGYFYVKDLLPPAFFTVVVATGSTLGPLLVCKLIFFALALAFLLRYGKSQPRLAFYQLVYYPLKLGEGDEPSVPAALPVLCAFILTLLT